MKKLRLFLFYFSFLLISLGQKNLSASIIDSSNSIERTGFYIQDLQICHQLEWRNLTVNIEIESNPNSENVSLVKQFVIEYLEKYSNEMDFWEIMNAKLVHAIVGEFAEIQMLKSTLSLKPDKTLSFPRQSIAVYSKNNEFLKESFSFTKLGYLICSETFDKLDLQVSFDINENPDPFDYPDYQWLDEAMNEYFKTHPMKISKWKEMKPELEAILMAKFPTLTAVTIDITKAE